MLHCIIGPLWIALPSRLCIIMGTDYQALLPLFENCDVFHTHTSSQFRAVLNSFCNMLCPYDINAV
jgi:hypothetical protein